MSWEGKVTLLNKPAQVELLFGQRHNSNTTTFGTNEVSAYRTGGPAILEKKKGKNAPNK